MRFNERGRYVLDKRNFKVITFDCYGTLIDWETGILEAICPILLAHGVEIGPQQILETYGELESDAESGKYIEYKDVLRAVISGFGERFGFRPSSSEREILIMTLKNWKPFPDVVEALKALGNRHKLGIISNIDDDLFAYTQKRLRSRFDYIVTAQQVRSYKPSLRNFEEALKKIKIPPSNILHVSQSLYHDIAPAKVLGLPTVQVNRRKGMEGTGATLPATVRPDLVVPDFKSLVAFLE